MILDLTPAFDTGFYVYGRQAIEKEILPMRVQKVVVELMGMV